MMPAASRNRYRARRWVFLAVVSLLSTLVVGGHGAPPAAAATNGAANATVTNAPLSQTSIITNNIQGATANGVNTANTDSKWSTGVIRYIRAANIVLIQEAGASGPPGARTLAPITIGQNTVQHFEWDPESSSRGGGPYQVYFLQTDDNGGTAVGGRVNIAIVTHDVPDEIGVVANPVDAGRDALGVRFGTNWYFSLHGLSRGPSDSAALVNAIATQVRSQNPSYTYTVGGDFNLEPASLTVPAGARILAPRQATHQSGGTLDYFVTNDPTSPATGPLVLDNRGGSDHWPVQLGTMQAAADTPQLRVMADGDNAPLYAVGLATTLLALLGTVSLGKRAPEFVGDDTTSNGTHYEDNPDADISGVASQDASAIPKYLPNVVLLQAGTWDIQDGDQSGAITRLSDLISQIQDEDPSAVIVLATLDPTANSGDEAQVTSYNTALEQMVSTQVDDGKRVVLADMSGLTTADLNSDGVTPNATGATIMADSFAGALEWAALLGWITTPPGASPPAGSVCDIYAYYGTPCVGAYSMTRAMYSGYDGPLYQVQRASDGATANIGLLSTGGDVNAAQQDSFCASTTCTVTLLYDQSPQFNNLAVAPGGEAAPSPDHGASATALPITIGGHEAYGLDITPGTGYRDNYAEGTAVKDEPEGMYMVASGTNVNSGCCFDFGNAETNSRDNGAGHMDAVNFSTTCYFAPCTGGGPWVEADLENGLFQGGNGSNTANTGLAGDDFVTAMLNNDGKTTYSLRGGNAQSGGLSTWWDGSLPDNTTGYKPMQKEGAIILGTGGDNSNSDTGSFFEGVMTDGYPSAAAGNAVQANISAAHYAGNSGGQAGSAPEAAGAAVTHGGYSSVFTVNASNDHLEESYLSNVGNSWATHDLNGLAGTPPVMAGTKPVALFHCGYTSVFTIDQNGDLQETYLARVGAPWATHDLTAMAHTPASHVTPTAVVHTAGATGQAAACGYTSVYTVDASTGELQETLDGW